MQPIPKNNQPCRLFPRWFKGALLLGIGLGLGLSLATSPLASWLGSMARYFGVSVPTAVAESKATVAASGANELKKSSESFRMIAKKVGPAVVTIQAVKGAEKQKGQRQQRRGRPPRGRGQDRGENPFGQQDPFFDFFERFGEPFFHPFPQPSPQQSLGSGVIIDPKGIIVTNNHVVEGANEVLVKFLDEKKELKAKIIGTDPRSDLAVLRLEKGGPFPFVEWADSDQVEVGDWAIAIGSPFALGHSVTVGIVSAKGRQAAQIGFENAADLIQTDAAINPGNSGGPLCDLEGKVIGVNTAIYTRSGGYMGIGFAISSNVAKDVVQKLITEGKVVRGWLGVYIQGVDPELAKELGITEGVVIHEVMEKSPAAEAGINSGDIVLEVDGKAVKDANQLQRLIAGLKPGQKVKIKVMSYADKKTRNVTVTIGTLPTEGSAQAGGGGKGESTDEVDRLGVIVSSRGKEGVRIEGVEPGSVADQVGLQQGDLIVRVNRKSIDSIATYKKLIEAGSRLYLEVKRGGRTLFFQFVLPE